MNQKSPATLTFTPPRHAFTMIELVFIIVILGILGAIAVPKMAASRDDAQIVAIKQDVATLIQAIPAMAMSQGAENITSLRSGASINLTNWTVYKGTDGTKGSEEAPMVLMSNDKRRNLNAPVSMNNACLVVALLSQDTKSHNIENLIAKVDNKGKSNAKFLYVRNAANERCKIFGEIGGVENYPLTGKSVKF